VARARADDGAAVVDFVLVSILVLTLFLLVFQVAEPVNLCGAADLNYY
jgi:uncharacterized protein (DUF983 family)